MFGTYSPLADVEVIAMMVRFFESLGLKGLSVNINSLGDAESLGNFKENLRKFFEPQLKELCTDCQRRFEKNILRVLDCKNPDCKKIAASPEVPTMRSSLTEEAKQHFESVLEILGKIGISYNENEKLVRGLDYYTHTIFEVTHSSLGAQDALGGGGRYNNLVKEFGGPPTGAVGFAIGVERLIIALKKLEQTETTEAISVFFVSFDEPALVENIVFAEKLRQAGISAVTGYKKQSVKAQMRQANSLGAKWVIMRGEDERQKNSVKIKNMETSEEKIVDENEIEENVR
jgi:histidyl-tRNA synthetase